MLMFLVLNYVMRSADSTVMYGVVYAEIEVCVHLTQLLVWNNALELYTLF